MSNEQMVRERMAGIARIERAVGTEDKSNIFQRQISREQPKHIPFETEQKRHCQSITKRNYLR